MPATAWPMMSVTCQPAWGPSKPKPVMLAQTRAGCPFADGIDVDPERFELAGLEGLDHDVCGLGEPAEEVAAVVLAEVERDGALVGVEVPEAQRGLTAGVVGMEGRESTRGVAARRLDLDHVGAEVGEQLAGVVSHFGGEIEHAHAVESCGSHAR